MIVRVQFVEMNDCRKKIIHTWCLFVVNKYRTLQEIFNDIYDKELSCGRDIELGSYAKDTVHASTVVTTEKCPTELMPTPLNISPADIKDDNTGSLYLEYELRMAHVDTEVETSNNHVASKEPMDTITSALMNRFDHYVSPKSTSTHGDVKLFNGLTQFVRENKFGVQGTALEDFREFLVLFSSLLWNIGPHANKIRERGGMKLHRGIEELLKFNDPKAHGHAPKSIKIEHLKSKVSQLVLKLERKYMSQRHMKSFSNMVLEVCDAVSKYSNYLETQRARTLENSRDMDVPCDDVPTTGEDIEDYTVRKLKQETRKFYLLELKKVRDLVGESDVYVPININENVDTMDRKTFFKLMKNMKENGFPLVDKESSIFHFRLPSHGPHPAVHFIWRTCRDDCNIETENTKLVVHLREKKKTFYSRASKKTIKTLLRRIGIVKPYKVEYVFKELLGDASAPVNETSASILARFNRYVQLGEDIIHDLRQNNGAVPKFDGFWDIVQKYIDDKTSIDDRRHCSSSGDDVVVHIAVATSLADIYRQCEQIAQSSDPPIDVPTYTWFLHQFWPTTKTISNMTHYTGRFEVKRMVQARMLRKENVDSHYTNAIYSFLKERACNDPLNTVMASADAKCKVSIGEPGYPIAAVSRGKRVVVGKNETLKVGDHDFSKVSLIPDAILFHTIPREDEVSELNENEENNKQTVGKWYTGQVFYSVKYMPLQGSTALRGVTELSKALSLLYPNDSIPPYLYLYTDGSGDRKNSNFNVQKNLLSLFFKHELDEVIAARPAANHSYRNPVERCHCIANLGLQSVGMMRTKQDDEFEKIISKCNGNEDIRKECEKNENFKTSFLKSVETPRELLEEVLSHLSLKENKFKIIEPATESEMEEFTESLSALNVNVDSINSSSDIKPFYEKHCVSRTYFFHIFKCDDINCKFHGPIRGAGNITAFPDPEPYEIDGIVHYRPGSDPKEKYLPSKLEDPEKRPHNVPFPPTAQTATNVGRLIKCEECTKPRLLHAKRKLSNSDLQALTKMICKFSYVCGSTLSEYQGTGAEPKIQREIFQKVFVRENLSCVSKIELPYYSVPFYKKICVWCGVSGTARVLGDEAEKYPKCKNCHLKPDVLRRKRKAITKNDLGKKKAK